MDEAAAPREDFDAIVGATVSRGSDRASRERFGGAQRRTWKTIVVCLVVVLMIFLGYKICIVQTVFGPCNRITGWCTDLPLKTLGMVAGYDWPDGTTVIKSEARVPEDVNAFLNMTGQRSVEVTVALGAGSPISTGYGWAYRDQFADGGERYYGPGDPRNKRSAPPDLGAGGAAFKAEGAKNIMVMRSIGDLLVLSGTRDGKRLIYVSCVYSQA